MRVLIVDDEASARTKIKRFLAAHPDCALVGEAETGPEAVHAIASCRPDLVFLDINLPELDGFEALAAVEPGRRPHVVFSTAYDARAVEAFDVNAVDYLLKPYDRGRFDSALDRARRRITGGGQERDEVMRVLEGLVAAKRYPKQLLVQDGSSIKVVDPEQIEYVSSSGNYATLHCKGKTYLMRASLASLAETLDPAAFSRVHRQTIVNTGAIVSIEPYGKGDMIIELRSGAQIKLSRRYKASLLEGLGR